MVTPQESHAQTLDELKVAIVAYNPAGLSYRFAEEQSIDFKHPLDAEGDPARAVGVHNIVTALDWEHNSQADSAGCLLWHNVSLAEWTGTRIAFAAADSKTQQDALTVGPGFNEGQWGTHFGATLTLITSDNKVVFRSRHGKYANQHLFDSYVAGTLMIDDLGPAIGSATTTEYLRLLLSRSGISMNRDVVRLIPTHLGLRSSDFGLWLGGFVQVGLNAAQVQQIAPFDTVVVEFDDNDSGIPLTDWGAFDVWAARTHYRGDEIVPRYYLP